MACNAVHTPAGKYYLYEDGVTDSESWFEISKENTWTDDDGVSGTYTLENEKIILYFAGEELTRGTLEDGRLALQSDYYNEEYYLEGKAPDATPIK